MIRVKPFIGLILALVALGFVTGASWETANATSSAELVANGDFESGDLSGWTVTTSLPASQSLNWVVNDGTVNPLFGPHGPIGPISGSFDALALGNSPSWETLSQSVSIPADIASATISWDDIVRNACSVFMEPRQAFRVLIEDASGGLIAEVWSTNPGDPAYQMGPNSRAIDVTALAQSIEGQTVVLSIEVEQRCYNLNVNVDNVSFLVDTVSTKADILIDSGVPGKGLSHAPGLDKEFNENSKAADTAGKKKTTDT